MAKDRDEHEVDSTSGSQETGSAEHKTWREMSKADVMAKMEGYREKQKAKAGQKVTAEDLDRKLAERKKRRETKRAQGRTEQEEQRRARLVRTVAIGALLVVSGGFVLGIKASDTRATEQVEQNQSRVVQLEEQIKEVTPEGTKEERQQELEAQLATAREEAGKVANLQNEFAAILYKGNDEKAPGDGSPSEAFIKSAEHRRELAPYFTESSWLVTDEDLAYGPGSAVPFDENTEIDPRFPWYVRYQAATYEKGSAPKYQDPDAYGWQVASVMPSSLDEPGILEVTWQSTNKDGTLLAWATANYNVSTKKFHALRVGETSEGYSLRVPTENDPDATQPKDKTGQTFPKEEGEG